MNLKAATILAAIGAGATFVIQVLWMVSPYVAPLAEFLSRGPGAAVCHLLQIMATASYLLFFITLAWKQRKGA